MQSRKGENPEMKTTGEMRIPISRSELLKVKNRALRKGVWYSALNRVERACIDLVIKLVERVRSRLLSNVLSSVLMKLDEAMESCVRRLTRDVGSKFATQLSKIAQTWGNKSAARWATDLGFMQYLTITHMNAPS